MKHAHIFFKKTKRFAFHIASLFVATLFISQSYAQNEDKWGTHGNTVDTSAFIGTTNSTDLRLRTNNVDRMRITEDGRIGIGVNEPEKTLDIDGDIRLSGDIIFKGYENNEDTIERFLTIDNFGKTQYRSLDGLRSSVYSIDCYKTTGGYETRGVVIGLTLPSWANRIAEERQILYTGTGCPTWVGIGTDFPQTRLDVQGDGRFTRGLKIGEDYQENKTALYIKNETSLGMNRFDQLILVRNSQGEKLFQLDSNGLLRTREVIVDEQNWPDYVFKKEYSLLPLNEVQNYIQENGHLPNVPSAKEIAERGLSLGNMTKVTMEKVEELTLYLLQMNERLEQQESTLNEQQNLIEEQAKLIQLQQMVIEQLKVNKE